MAGNPPDKVCIMQPYFFPYLGYFQLIHAADKWIFFDTPQYIRHGWVNRNRILKGDGNEWLYITVPLEKHARETPINQVKISYNEKWREKILAQLSAYKKKAPFFKETMAVVEKSLQKSNESLLDLTIASVVNVCDYLGIDFKYDIYSSMNLVHPEPTNSGEWALYISKAIGAHTYINPPGGREIFQVSRFDQENIKLLFLDPDLKPYNQKNTDFINGLSIIDVMMFNEIEVVQKMCSSYSLAST